MTSSVTVNAHCSDDKHLLVSVTGAPDVTIPNGGYTVVYAYDDRVITVKEVLKSTAATEAPPVPSEAG